MTSLALASAAAAYGLVPLLLPHLRRWALARPNVRSSHAVPTPQGAGLAVIPVALAAGVAVTITEAAPPAASLLHLAAVGVAILGLMMVGILDDIFGLPVLPRLSAHALAALLVVATLPSEFRILPSPFPLLAERALLLLAVVWFVNLFNFMDGIDWISASETAAITLGIALLAAVGCVSESLGWIATMLFAAVLGFAPWNAPPARVFLGDAGSLPLGLMLAALLIHVAAAGAIAAALILPLYYLADAGVTLLRRLLRGERVWEAHREHFYQRALKEGLSVRAIIARIAVLNAVLVVLALTASVIGTSTAAWVAVTAAALAVAGALGMLVRSRHSLSMRNG